MRHVLPLALMGLIAAACQPRSTGKSNQPDRSTMGPAAMAGMTRLRPEPRPRTRRPPTPPPRRRTGPGDAFALANAPGVTAIDPAKAGALPYVSVSLARVVTQAKRHCRAHWYGLYLNGRKLGYAEMGCRLKQLRGKTVFERHSTLVMQAKMYATMVKIEMTTLARFATTGRGELLYYEYKQKGIQQNKALRITKKADGWHSVQTYQAGAIRKPPSRKVLKQLDVRLENGEAALTTLLIEGKLRPGQKLRFRELDPEDVVVRDSAAQLLASGTRVLRGVKVRLHKMEVIELHRKLRGITLVDAAGNWLDGRLQGTIRIRREEKATAKTVDPNAGDFGLGVVIKAQMNVKDPAKVSQLRLSLTGYLPATLKQNPRHKLVSRGAKSAELTITRESLQGLPTALLPQLATKFPKALAATQAIEVKNPVIQKLAQRAVGGEKNALAAARKLNTFVYKYLRKSLSTNLDSALAIARARAGDCTEHARLMVALCRAVGLPAREVGGVTWVPDLGGFGYHAWVEVWVGKWVSADPSWNELPVNATHIHMGGPNDVQWIGTLGALRAKILSVKQNP